MEVKSLFSKYQPELVKLANSDDGRNFLDIGKEVKEKIVGLSPNAYFTKVGRNKYKGVFRCYPLFAKKLAGVISKVEITRNEKLYQKLGRYKGLLHYAGLFEQPRVFPQVFLASGDPIYSGAGDGNIYAVGGDGTWDTPHDATTGTNAYPTQDGTANQAFVICGWRGGADFYIGRSFFPFDTSGIGAGATIESPCYVYLYPGADTKVNTDNDGEDYVAFVQTTQPDETTLTTADFNLCGSVNTPTIGSDNKDFGNITDGQYNMWTLNPTGRGWIDPTSWTKLGAREGHDILDHSITNSTNTGNRLYPYFSEYTGTDRDPKLVVTYTAGGEGPSIVGWRSLLGVGQG